MAVEGDTIEDIAWASDSTKPELVELNGLSNPDLLQIGQVLLVPSRSTTPVVTGDGVTDEMPEDPPPPTQLGAGHSLVVASDGITEAFNPSGEMFGDARLIETLTPTVCGPPDATIATLRSAVRKWHGKDEPHDDQTAVVVVRR